MTGLWERRFLPRLVEGACGSAPLHRLRAEVCASLTGEVLELGVGSGLNAGHYPAEVTRVGGVEPNDLAWSRAVRRFADGPPLHRVGLDAQRLDAEDASFDGVLTTFVLCTVPDQETALAEAFRVLRPGGALHFLEHGSADSAVVRRWQRRLEPVQRRVAGGCHLTRRPDRDLLRAGFVVEQLVTEPFEGPALSSPFGFGYRGVARKPR